MWLQHWNKNYFQYNFSMSMSKIKYHLRNAVNILWCLVLQVWRVECGSLIVSQVACGCRLPSIIDISMVFLTRVIEIGKLWWCQGCLKLYTQSIFRKSLVGLMHCLYMRASLLGYSATTTTIPTLHCSLSYSLDTYYFWQLIQLSQIFERKKSSQMNTHFID